MFKTKKSFRIVTCLLVTAVMITSVIAFGSISASAGTGKVYTNLVEQTSNTQFTGNTKYIVITSGAASYNNTFASTDCLLGIPNGAGIVQSTATPFVGTGSASAVPVDLKSNVAVDVTIVQQGTGFDGCGGSFYGSSSPFSYYCKNGGNTNVKSKIFTYVESTYSDNDITVSLKSNVEIPTGTKTLTSNDINVKLKIVNTDYNITGYTFTDPTVNYRNGDTQIGIDFGGVTKTLTVNTDGLAKKVWEEDYATEISQTTVSAGDVDNLQEAITKGGDAGATEAELAPLRNKLAAAQYLADHADALAITDPTADDFNTLDEAVNDFNELDPDIQQYIDSTITDPATGTLMVAYEEAGDAVISDAADAFISKYVTGKDGKIYKKVTDDNYKQILAGKGDWESLSKEVKDAVNAKLEAAGSKPYEELLYQAIEKAIVPVQTGDYTKLLPWLVLLLVSAVICVGFPILKRSKYSGR